MAASGSCEDFRNSSTQVDQIRRTGGGSDATDVDRIPDFMHRARLGLVVSVGGLFGLREGNLSNDSTDLSRDPLLQYPQILPDHLKLTCRIAVENALRGR